MTKVERTGFEIDVDFLFFYVDIEKDNHDRHHFAFMVSHLTEYKQEDMALETFVIRLKSLTSDLEKYI